MTPPFEKFVKNREDRTILTFDPGETTGYSIWKDMKLHTAGQIKTVPVFETAVWLRQFIRDWDPKVVVIEEYRVYSHKTDDHAHNDMHTSRLIGCMESILAFEGKHPPVMQSASSAKGFCTDEKLKDWDFWQKGERHARDAIRHGVYFLCHGKSIRI